ncbi:MAG: DUF2069 domain-containing protein [Halioglobus sp.]
MKAAPRIGSAKICWLLLWMCLGLLLCLQTYDGLVRAMPWYFIVGLKVLPLLLFVPAMLKDNMTSFIWLCFVSLMYFIVAVERIFAEPSSPLAILGLVAVVGLFLSAMLYVRKRGPQLRAGATPQS